MSNGKDNKKLYKMGKHPRKDNGNWINQYTPYKHLLDEPSHELPVKSLDTIIKPIERNVTSLTSTKSLVHEKFRINNIEDVKLIDFNSFRTRRFNKGGYGHLPGDGGGDGGGSISEMTIPGYVNPFEDPDFDCEEQTMEMLLEDIERILQRFKDILEDILECRDSNSDSGWNSQCLDNKGLYGICNCRNGDTWLYKEQCTQNNCDWTPAGDYVEPDDYQDNLSDNFLAYVDASQYWNAFGNQLQDSIAQALDYASCGDCNAPNSYGVCWNDTICININGQVLENGQIVSYDVEGWWEANNASEDIFEGCDCITADDCPAGESCIDGVCETGDCSTIDNWNSYATVANECGEVSGTMFCGCDYESDLNTFEDVCICPLAGDTCNKVEGCMDECYRDYQPEANCHSGCAKECSGCPDEYACNYYGLECFTERCPYIYTSGFVPVECVDCKGRASDIPLGDKQSCCEYPTNRFTGEDMPCCPDPCTQKRDACGVCVDIDSGSGCGYDCCMQPHCNDTAPPDYIPVPFLHDGETYTAFDGTEYTYEDCYGEGYFSCNCIQGTSETGEFELEGEYTGVCSSGAPCMDADCEPDSYNSLMDGLCGGNIYGHDPACCMEWLCYDFPEPEDGFSSIAEQFCCGGVTSDNVEIQPLCGAASDVGYCANVNCSGIRRQNDNPIIKKFKASTFPQYYKPDGSLVKEGEPLHKHQDGTIMTEHSMGRGDKSVIVKTALQLKKELNNERPTSEVQSFGRTGIQVPGSQGGELMTDFWVECDHPNGGWSADAENEAHQSQLLGDCLNSGGRPHVGF